MKTKKLFLASAVASALFAGKAAAGDLYSFDFLAPAQEVSCALSSTSGPDVLGISVMLASLGLILVAYHLIAKFTGVNIPWDPNAPIID